MADVRAAPVGLTGYETEGTEDKKGRDVNLALPGQMNTETCTYTGRGRSGTLLRFQGNGFLGAECITVTDNVCAQSVTGETKSGQQLQSLGSVSA